MLLAAAPWISQVPAVAAAPQNDPVLSVQNLMEGADAVVRVSNNAAGDTVVVAFSLAGPGPTNTVFGDVDLSQPIVDLPPLTADGSGVASTSQSIPMGTAGLPVWLQAVNVSNGLLSNSLAETIEAYAPPGDMVMIPAGTFDMGRHVGNGPNDELPIHAVTISAFRMDRYEVRHTPYIQHLNDLFAAGDIVVNAGIVTQVGGAGQLLAETTDFSDFSRIVWNGSSFSVLAGAEDHPLGEVSWYGACLFANWRSQMDGLTPCYDPTSFACNFNTSGYRLPTEAEWEYAARGGGAYTAYHWGNIMTGADANYWDSGDPWNNGNYPETTPVGYYDGNQTPNGDDRGNGYGLYDMSGNMWEWCNDYYDGNYYSTSPSTNPTGPATGTNRSFRGGAWISDAHNLRTANRFFHEDVHMSSALGFRLVARP